MKPCLSYLVARRWSLGVQCPRCGNPMTFTMPPATNRFTGNAASARQERQISLFALAGTIFENTKKPLRDWFRVTHLMLASKKGMSALQIQRMMGFGSYKTAHGMCHKIFAPR